MPKTQRWIRCLANKAKSQKRTDVIEYLRTIVPAGTTGTSTTKTLCKNSFFLLLPRGEILPSSKRSFSRIFHARTWRNTSSVNNIATSFSTPLEKGHVGTLYSRGRSMYTGLHVSYVSYFIHTMLFGNQVPY